MLLSYKWLQDYVEVPWEPEELARRLTMAGLEVEGLQPFASDLDGVYVGCIRTAKPHPHAGNLKICAVDVGARGNYQIICGAPNAAAGQKVAAALSGAKLPGGLEISIQEIRGVPSQGMLCSQAELGISEDHEGIWVLPPDLEPGRPLAEALDLDDLILDVAVYANRPDCMSVLGIAREVAALTGGKIRLPSVEYEQLDLALTEHTSVAVQAEKLCPRYTATLLRNLTVGPSPLWMQLRLRAAGMRPINNVVDTTNYVMLETGQPLHAFDYEKLEGRRLEVRTAREGETITTLDGEKRELSGEMLLICDAQNPMCIAGIMGGTDSEVSADSRTILLEAANFSAQNIRRTSRALGLSSESSARFEKGIDPHGTVFASKRTAHFLQALAGAEVYGGHLDLRSAAREQKLISFQLEQIKRLLGVEIPKESVKNILESLEFEVEEKKPDVWQVKVPTHRPDLEIEADLIEEILRIWGLEHLPSTLPADTSQTGGQSRRLDVTDGLRQILIGAGLQEALCYSFGRADNNDRLLRFNRPMLKVQNPLSEDLVALRHSLLPGLLAAVGLNSSRQQNRVALFEIGAVYLGEISGEEQPLEEFQLALALWGWRNCPNWGLPQENYDYYDLKGILELILPAADQLKWGRGADPAFHPGRQGQVCYQGREIACFGEVHPAVLRNFKVPGRVYAAEIRFELILSLFDPLPVFEPLPKYPAVERDLALVVDEQQSVGELAEHLRSLGGQLLSSVTLFDVYTGKSVPEGKKSVAFSCRFQGDRTLVDQEVNEIMGRCLAGMKDRFGAEIR